MRDRLIATFCWLGIFLAGAGISSIVVATRVHGQIIKPFDTDKVGEPLPVCWDAKDSYDVSVGVLKKKSVWNKKVKEGKCAILTFPWFYSKIIGRNGKFYLAEVQMKNGKWHTLYAIFQDLPHTVGA